MKTLTKMFLLSCWCLLSVSFAKETLEEIKTNQEQQLIQEKNEIIESYIESQEQTQITIQNNEAEKIAYYEALKAAEYLLKNSNSGPISIETQSIETQIDEVTLEKVKEEILLKGYTVEEYIQAVNADRIANEKKGAVSFEAYQEGLNAKEQATLLEYNLQPPSNTEGEVVTNPKVPHLKGFSPEGLKNIRADQDKVDYYENLKLNPTQENPYVPTRDCVDTDGGATDAYGDGCDGYTLYPSWCGGYDDDDFTSTDMCCACGGGEDDGAGGGDECTDNAIALSVGGGSYCSEVSWDLSDGSSGSCGDFDLCLADGDYTFNGYDSWGDGWNGNTASFSDADGNVLASFAVEGSSGSWTLTVGGAPPVGGCTDASAPNYNADAEVDDGSCEAYCGDGSGCGGYLNYGYTCEELTGYGYDCSACEAEGLCPVLGCTDPDSADYNENANTDDGSCTYPCDGLVVSLCDAYGDSWNGNVLTIGDQSFEPVSGDPCEEGCYTGATDDVAVTCDGGSWQSEVSWSISDADGNVLLSGGAPYSGVLNPSAPPVCEDESACNNGAEGDCEYAATGYNCDGSLADGYHADCSGQSVSDGYLGWIGDGYCDDGAYGIYYDCCEYNFDNGDCGNEIGCDGVAVECGGAVNDDCGECAGDNSTCADCAGVANGDSWVDCANACLDAYYLSYLGDGFCDDGAWGVDLVSCADFNCDNGDCGTELIDGTCQSSGCSDDQFTCSNGDCIPAGYYCDGSSEWGNAGWGPDCADGSDELFDECCDAGAYADDLCNPPPTCSDIGLVVGGGSWDSEITWDLSDGSSGAAGTFALCLDDGDYTFIGYDAYGDGWNGASATFTDADGNVIASFAVEGETGSWTLTIGGAPPVGGCTDPNAPNYNADAEVDDGTCEEYCGSTDCGAYIAMGYDCATLEGYGYDCSVCDASGDCPTVSDCAAAGGNDSYLGDGWCDGSNNQEACGYDAGDCCPGDCVSTTYDCATYGGDCDDCADPNSADLAEGGQCADTPPDTTCDECEFDWTPYGAECCDAAAGDFGLSCGALEGNYGWDCSGCGCPLDECTSDDDCAEGQTCSNYTCADPPEECDGLVVTLTDAYGDGWNGNVLTVGTASYTLDNINDDGAYAEGCYTGPSDVAVTCDGGSWQSEVSWTVGDLSGGAPYSGCLGTCTDGCTDANADNYDPDADFDDGSCDYGCGANEVTLVVGGGSWESEVSWDFAGTSGGAPSTTILCLEDGDYDFTGCDAYGDGWNGSTANFYEDGSLFASWAGPDAALNAGECETVTISVGVDVVSGCTDGSACNYDENATLDDGSCLQFDCADECGGAAVDLGCGCNEAGPDDCGECGGDGTACADCAYPQWYGDGYCDGSNNTPECDYDAGDCCPGDCVDNTYDCETFGGDCLDCADPDSADNAPGGQCDDVVVGCTDPYADNYDPNANTDDGSCIYEGCAAGLTPGCSDQDIADGDCASSTWIGDGLCDGYSEAWGVNFCCYDLDGGDCTEAECNPPEAWDASITGLTAEGVNYDYYGTAAPAVQWDWDDLSDGDVPPETCEDQGLVTCDDGSCAATAEDCAATTCADGSDPLVDCIGTEFCDEDCANASYDGCISGESNWTNDSYCDDGAYGLVFTCPEYGCDDCACGASEGCEDCTDPGEDTDSAECAASFTVYGYDVTPDTELGDCYTDGTGYFLAVWEGACLATSLTYQTVGVDNEETIDLAAYGFTGSFYFYGFGNEESVDFLITFNNDDANGLGAASATTACPSCEGQDLVTCDDGSCATSLDACLSCADQGLWDCGDGQCIPDSYICDGSSEFCNASWGPDCANGADEGLELCGYEDECDGEEPVCADCEFDWSAYGAECCDAAWDAFGINCADLEANYGWDCAGCACPGDEDTGDGGDCVNDDSTSDSYGDTCTSWYDSYESPGSSGCEGAYNDDDFDASVQCCVCQGDRDSQSTVALFNVLSTDNNENAKVYHDRITKYKRSIADGLMSANKTLNTVDASVMINVLTGEVTYSDNYSNDNRDVSYTINVSCDTCLSGGPWSGAWEVAQSDFLVYGFDAGSSVCGNVTGNSTLLGSTEASDDACANAGGEVEECEFFDCSGAEACGVEGWVGDGYCDDGTWGYYFNCDEFDCDGGDCAVDCWDGSSACSGNTECPEEPTCLDGDVNGDDQVNVTDIVSIVNFILGGGSDGAELECGDMNGDGVINVTDIVSVVNYILGGGTAMNSDRIHDVTITIKDDALYVSSDEVNVQGLQLTLSHDSDFEIELMDVNGGLEVAEYNTIDENTTIVVIVSSDLDNKPFATTKGDFIITEKTVVDEFAQEMNVKVNEIVDFSLKAAYPNPFNPSTTLELVLPEAGYVSIKVYNLVGQEVATLADGMMEANPSGHVFQWNASGIASGVYLVRAEGAGQISTQKLMLLK